MIVVKLLGVLLAGSCGAYNGYRDSGYRPRVFEGVPDTNNKYPYIISLVMHEWRQCTGTLIAPNWVLTAAHCSEYPQIRYGDMTTIKYAKITYSNVAKRILHPGYRQLITESTIYFIHNDIALLKVEKVPLSSFGKLSAVDYTSLSGKSVEYAGFGATFLDADNISAEEWNDEMKPLQLGQGMVASCPSWYNGPIVCVAPKCDKRHQDVMHKDSGAPLFYDGKIVALVSMYYLNDELSGFVPVSPYLSWISNTINSRK